MSAEKFLYIDDIPTPYRLGVFRLFRERFEGEFRLLFCAPNEEGREWDLPLDDLNAHIMKVKRFRLPGMHHAFSGKWNPEVRAQLAAFAPDVIAFSGYLHPTVHVAARHCRRNGIPYGMSCETSFLQREANSIRMRTKRHFLRKLVRGMSFGLPCGSKAEEYLRVLGAKHQPMYHFPNTPDIDQVIDAGATVANNDDRVEFLERAGIDPEVSIVLFVGRYAEAKRPLDLLEAFDRLQPSAKKSSALVLIGDGPMKAAVQARIESMSNCRVHSMGWMDPQDVYRFMSLARIMVLPSGKEPWGAVVNESMAVGTPVIASDKVGAAHDLIRHRVTGWKYPAGNLDSLLAALHEILDADLDLETMRARARQAARAGDASFAATNLLRAIDVALS